MRSAADIILSMAVSLREAHQLVDDVWFKAWGKHALRMKSLGIVSRDRLLVSRVWEGA